MGVESDKMEEELRESKDEPSGKKRKSGGVPVWILCLLVVAPALLGIVYWKLTKG